MASNTYVVEYAKTGRASCKLKNCGKTIEKDALRIGKRLTSAFFSSEGSEVTNWYHPGCMFLTLSRAKASTKKIDSTTDLPGFGSLEPADQKLIKDYISGKMALPNLPPLQKKKKAAAGGSDAGPASPASSSPKPKPAKTGAKKKKGSTLGKVLKAWAVRETDGQRVELPVGGTFFGRGPDTGIDDKKCSRSQVEVSVSPGSVEIRVNGVNPSVLFRADGQREMLEKGAEADLADGDTFCVLADQYRYRVHIQREGEAPKGGGGAALPAAKPAAKAKRPRSDEEEEAPLDYGDDDEEDEVGHGAKAAPKLARLSEDDDDVGGGEGGGSGKSAALPVCKYGKNCYRVRNPQHLNEFAHPWLNE